MKGYVWLVVVALSLAPAPARAALFWGDLHVHSGLSNDATGAPDNLFTLARDVVGLDFVALTDHDIFLTNAEWDILRATAASFNDEGTFVTFSANEWTRVWHMNAYFLNDNPILCRACTVDSFNTIYGAYVAAGTAAAHVNHPLDPPYPVDWSTIDDTVTTSVEVWNSGSGDNEVGFGGALWALQVGFRLGLVGVSDDHHTDQLPRTIGTGITGCWADTLTRDDLLTALRARRCYASNGERIELDLDVDGTPMGGELTTPLHTTLTVTVPVLGTDIPSAIEILRNGVVVASKTDCATVACTFAAPVEVLEEHTFIYARVHQPGGKTAWSSPVWVHGQCVLPADCPLARLTPGSGSVASDCLTEWLTLPAADTRPNGAPLARLTCVDGDPACDVGTTPDECTVRVGICVGPNDPRLASCTPAAVDSYEVVRPSGTVSGLDAENRKTLRAAFRALGPSPAPGTCTPPVELRVPISISPRGVQRAGHRRLKTEAVAGTRTDRDRLLLVCEPG